MHGVVGGFHRTTANHMRFLKLKSPLSGSKQEEQCHVGGV